jgi:hypothetical protein
MFKEGSMFLFRFKFPSLNDALPVKVTGGKKKRCAAFAPVMANCTP